MTPKANQYSPYSSSLTELNSQSLRRVAEGNLPVPADFYGSEITAPTWLDRRILTTTKSPEQKVRESVELFRNSGLFTCVKLSFLDDEYADIDYLPTKAASEEDITRAVADLFAAIVRAGYQALIGIIL